jgi:hypothetical protein
MPTINEACLALIDASSTLEERAEICLGLRKQGWTKEQAEAATGLEWVFDDDNGHRVRLVELVPYPMLEQ